MQTKINDLSNSAIRKKYLEQNFTPETNYSVRMARVSTKNQKDKGQSDDAQVERMIAYVSRPTK